jgi:hypothetical protein
VKVLSVRLLQSRVPLFWQAWVDAERGGLRESWFDLAYRVQAIIDNGGNVDVAKNPDGWHVSVYTSLTNGYAINVDLLVALALALKESNGVAQS